MNGSKSTSTRTRCMKPVTVLLAVFLTRDKSRTLWKLYNWKGHVKAIQYQLWYTNHESFSQIHSNFNTCVLLAFGLVANLSIPMSKQNGCWSYNEIAHSPMTRVSPNWQSKPHGMTIKLYEILLVRFCSMLWQPFVDPKSGGVMVINWSSKTALGLDKEEWHKEEMQAMSLFSNWNCFA